MTYHATVTADGGISVPEGLVRELGVAPGTRLRLDRDGDAIVIRLDQPNEADAALARLRAAFAGYTVDHFLAERRQDWAEE